MLGPTVIIPTALVPQMGGGNEDKAKFFQTLLFVAGLNRLLQTWFGTKLPAVIGGSYTFVAHTISIILSGRLSDPDPALKFKKILRATQGAYIFASTIQIILGFSGLWRNVARLPSVLQLGCHNSFYWFFSLRSSSAKLILWMQRFLVEHCEVSASSSQLRIYVEGRVSSLSRY